MARKPVSEAKPAESAAKPARKTVVKCTAGTAKAPAAKKTVAPKAAAEKPVKAAAAKPAPAKAKAAPAAKAAASAKEQAAAPKAPRARKRAPRLTPDRLELLVEAARASLEDDKAENIVVLDVSTRSTFTDRMIIATGVAERQIQAMATHVEDALAENGLKLKKSAFETSPEWVLIDAGDIVIHLFMPEERDKFNLEKLWGEDSPSSAG